MYIQVYYTHTHTHVCVYLFLKGLKKLMKQSILMFIALAGLEIDPA